MKKICLIGGSFNPVHSGHTQIINYCYQQLKFDEIWVVLNNMNPFKDYQELELATWKQRKEMLEIELGDRPYVKILDIESDAKAHRTFDSVIKLTQAFPFYTFVWVIGQDLIRELPTWYKFEALIKMIDFISFYRHASGNLSETEQKICDKYNIKVYNCDFVNISSAEVRNGVRLEFENPAINNYINEQALYLRSRLLYADPHNQKRLEHSEAVAKMAVKLAKIYNYLDLTKAYLAGMLHDITKYWNNQKQVMTIEAYEASYLIEHPKTYHAISGSIYLRECLKIKNSDVINAVKFHTIGACKEMDELAKIIYIADKVSLDRSYDGVQQLRELAYKNLNQCFIQIIQQQYKNHKHTLNPESRVWKIYEYWTSFNK